MKRENGVREEALPGGIGRVEDLLIQRAAMAEHGQTWLDAAHRGEALNLLREEHARHTGGRLPVWEYLAGLASQAKISLDAALAAFELRSQPVVNRQTASRIAEVLKHIGCTAEETMQMLQLSFAEVHGYWVSSDRVIAWRDGKVSDAAMCEEALRRAEARYPAELREELGDIRVAVLRHFSKEG